MGILRIRVWLWGIGLGYRMAITKGIGDSRRHIGGLLQFNIINIIFYDKNKTTHVKKYLCINSIWELTKSCCEVLFYFLT